MNNRMFGLESVMKQCIWALMLAVSVSGCRDQRTVPTAVEAESPLASLQSEDEFGLVRGCAGVGVELTNPHRVHADVATPDDCGDLQINPEQVRYDQRDHVLSLRVTMKNRSDRHVLEPLRILADADNLIVVAPVGLASQRPHEELVRPLNASSEEAETGAGVLHTWSLADEQLAPQQKSTELELRFWVHPGVRQLRLGLHAVGQQATSFVPAVAPSTIPSWVYAEENIERDSPLMTGEFVRNLVMVAFRENTAQPVRQQIVEQIGGRVVGGRHIANGDGFYAVLIEDDGTAGPLMETTDALYSIPEVWVVKPEFVRSILGPSRRFPSDGAGWDSLSWVTIPDSAAGSNWGMEAISAPLAWGCSTGGLSARVAVVDNGFHSSGADFRNVTHADGVGSFANSDHGTSVAHVLGAYGNDSTGVTGVLWRTDLQLYDAAVDSAGTAVYDSYGQPDLSSNIDRAIYAAAASGAGAINLSVGLDWNNLKGPGYTPGTSGDSAIVENFSLAVRAVLDSALALGDDPLFVISAGNDGVSAYWSGFPNVVHQFPDNVIVVGAHARGKGNQWPVASFSNTGPLVSVLAPGERVQSVGKSGLVTVSGTSFAAPHVTGIAGLLKEFDPTLTAADLRRLVIEGADSAGYTAGGYPVANAYWSLKLAARRPGARLCGNRIWTEGNALHVERRNGSEPIVVSPYTISAVDALHGGKAVRWQRGWTQWMVARWDSLSGWASTYPEADEFGEHVAKSGDPYLSRLGRSHSGDTVVVAHVVRSGPQSPAATVEVGLRIGGSTATVALTTIPFSLATAPWVCTKWAIHDPFCIDGGWGAGGEVGAALAVYPPHGRDILVLISIFRTGFRLTGGVYNGSNWDVERETMEVRAFAVNIDSGAYRHLWTRPGLNVQEASLSSDGTQLAVELHRENSALHYAWTRVDYEEVLASSLIGSSGYSRCVRSYWDLETGTAIWSSPEEDCHSGQGEASFAP